MHKKGIVGVLLIVGIAAGAWAQQAANLDPSIKVPLTPTTAPTSSVDLLQQSAQKASPFADVSVTKKAPKVPPVPKSTVASTTTVSTTTVTKPAGENTLDMPLNIGGVNTSVQTKVSNPTPKKTTSKKWPTLSTTPSTTQASTDTLATQTQENTEEDAADAELAYAVKMLEKSKQEARAGDHAIPASAAKHRPTKVPSRKKAFNPNAFRPGVEWVPSKSKHFTIYTQKPNGSIGSSNIQMIFEGAYDTLHLFIPWMMSSNVRVFVYRDHNSYLRYEPEAQAWQHALAYPTRGEIVVYDEPDQAQEIKKVFAHELTHIFTQQFFDKHDTGRIMTPTWLDEGLAVFVEDQVLGRHGPWDHDYRTMRFERDPRTEMAHFGSNRMFGRGYEPKPFVPIAQRGDARRRPHGKPVRLMPFEDFMREGSLETAEGQGNLENWYRQAYLMVRFLINTNNMHFQEFTRLIAQGEAVRDSSTGFLVKDSRGKQVYKPYSVEKALSKSYNYHNIAAFEDAFWAWLRGR